MKHFSEYPKQIARGGGGEGQNSNIYCNKNSLALLTQLPETILNRKSNGKIIVKAL